MKLINDDCMNVLPTLADRSINLIVCDLPYDCDKTRASWDKSLDLAALFAEYRRVIKPNGAMTFTNMILSGLKIYRRVLQTPTIAL